MTGEPHIHKQGTVAAGADPGEGRLEPGLAGGGVGLGINVRRWNQVTPEKDRGLRDEEGWPEGEQTAQALAWVSLALIPAISGLRGLSPPFTPGRLGQERLREITSAQSPHGELQAVLGLVSPPLGPHGATWRTGNRLRQVFPTLESSQGGVPSSASPGQVPCRPCLCSSPWARTKRSGRGSSPSSAHPQGTLGPRGRGRRGAGL